MIADTVGTSLGIVAVLSLFLIVGLVFLFANLLVGRFLRPDSPNEEKLDIYECGEPTIGSSFVQFDLRFYVVALLFIIFDVEVAFFFPWATFFGKANNLSDPWPQNEVVRLLDDGSVGLTSSAEGVMREMGIRNPVVPDGVPESLAGQVTASGAYESAEQVIKLGSKQLAWLTIVDIVIFFTILIVGFAYVWKRGDLDWVRAVSEQRSVGRQRAGPASQSDQVVSV